MPPDLVDQLRGGDAPVDAGRFRIDSRRALEKLRQFRLADPHHYVLELLRAAVASRASWARVHTDADDFELTFNGEPFTPAQLNDVLALALQGGEGRDAARGRLLSLGVAGALAMEPRWVRIHSGQMLVELDGHGQVKVSAAPALAGRASTFIHVRERLSWRVARDAVLGSREAKVIAELCRELPIPLKVNEQPLAGGGSFGEPVLARAQREKEGTRVLVAFPARPLSHSLVRFHVFGVQVCERRWIRLKTPVLAVVHDDSLQRNASGSDVVEGDPHYQRAMGMLEGLVEALLEQLAQRVRSTPDAQPQARELLLLAAQGAAGRLRGVIESAPLLPGPSGEWVSASELREEHAAGRPIRYATRRYAAGSYTRPALLLPECDPRALRILPGKPRVDVAEEVALRHAAVEQRHRFDAQVAEEPRLPPREWVVRGAVNGKGFHGEVGVLARGGQRATVRVLVERKLLFVESPDDLPPGTVAVVNLSTPPPLDAWAKTNAGVTVQRFSRTLESVLLHETANAVAVDPALPGELRPLARWLVGRALRAARTVESLSLPAPLRLARVFDLAGGGRASLAELLEWDVIRHVEQPWNKPLLDGSPAVTLAPRGEAGELARLLGERRVEDVTERLRKETRVRERLDAGPEQVACRVPLLISLPIQDGDFRGVVGLPVDATAPAQLRLYVRDLLVEEVPINARYGLASAAITSDSLSAREDWSVVLRDGAFDDAMELVRQGERALMSPLVQAYGARDLSRWPSSARKFFRAFAHQELTALLGKSDLDALAAEAADAAVVPTSQGPRSLRALAELGQRQKRLWFQESPDRAVPKDMLVVFGDQVVSTMVRAVAQVPEADLAEELARREARSAFFSRSRREPVVDESLQLIVPVRSGEELRGQVGGPTRHVGTRVELLLGGRELRTQHQETALQLEATIDLPQDSVNPGEPLPPSWERAIADAVEQAELEIFELGAERWDWPEVRALVYRGLGANLDVKLPRERRQALLDRPLVPTGDGQWLPVSHFDEARHVGYVTRPVNGVPRSGPVVLADSRAVEALLPRWTASDVTRRVEEELAARARRESLPRHERFTYAGKALWRVPLEGSGARGEIAFLGARTGMLELYHHGRALCVLREEAFPACAAVVVNDDRLTPTTDETGVVLDRAYHALVREVLEALDDASQALAEKWMAAPEQEREELRPLALQLAAWQARRKGGRSALLSLPLLSATDGRPITLASLVGSRTTGRPVLWSSVPGALLGESRPVWHPRPGERQLLAELSLPLEDVSARVRAAEERRARAKAETFQVALQSPFREPFAPPRRGEVVLAPDEPSGTLHLNVLKDGVLLESLQLQHEVGAVVKVQDPALAATKGWTKASRNAAFRDMREAVELAVERAVVKRLSSQTPGWLPYARAAIQWRSGSAGPLAEALPALELFRDVRGVPVRLGEVLAEVSRRGAVAVLEAEMAGSAPPERLVLARGEATLALLADLQLRAEDVTQDARAVRDVEASRAARRLQSLQFGGDALVRLAVDRPGGFRGELALPANPSEERAVVLAREGVAVTEAPVGGLGVAGVLEHPALAVDAAWQSAELTREQREDLQEEVDALFIRLAGVSPAFEPAQRAAAAPYVLRYLKERGMKDASQLERLPEVAQRVADAPVFRAAEGRWVGLRTAADQALRRNGLAVLGAAVRGAGQLPALALVAKELESEWVLLLGEVLGFKRVQVIRDLEVWREAQAQAEPDDGTPLARGLDRLRREASLLRADAMGRLTKQELAQIRLHRRGGKGTPIRYNEERKEVLLDPENPSIRAALESAAERPEGVYVLLASIYGAINRALERVTDEDEARMLGALTRHLAANPELLKPASASPARR